MSRFLEIRTLLDLTQLEMAEVLGCGQSNVSFLDRGQRVMPDVAGKLVEAARALGIALTFEHVYGREDLPQWMRRAPVEPRPHDWAGLLDELAARGWTSIQIAVRIGARVATVRALTAGDLQDAPHAIGCSLLALHAGGERPLAQPAKAA